jgi:ketosteroid isomerase-like protein
VPDERRELVSTVYERWNLNDGDLALELFDPDVEIRQQPYVFDTAGTFHGHEGLVGSARELRASFRSIDWRPQRWTEHADWLLVELEVTAIGSHSGIPVEREVVHAWRFRDGRVSDLRVYSTKSEMTADLNEEEQR